MRLVHLTRRFVTIRPSCVFRSAPAKNRIIRTATTGTAKNHVFRNATSKEIDLFTQRTIGEGWHVGPYDYQCGFAFDPNRFFVHKVGSQMVNQITAVRYPNSHSHLGGSVVAEKFRGKGHFKTDVQNAMKYCNQRYTIGADCAPHLTFILKREGFTRVWDTYAASFNIQKIAKILAMQTFPSNIFVKSIHKVHLEKFLEYDRSVFGTDRRVFMEKWISAPGTFGYAAVDGNDKIVGYAVLKLAIRGGGTEIGLAMAPLYADDPQIAKCLLKTVADRCLANEAVPKTKLEMVHPVGDICGEGAPLLMAEELEAELTHITDRMYTIGIPPGRQTKKIYGIASPAFD